MSQSLEIVYLLHVTMVTFPVFYKMTSPTSSSGSFRRWNLKDPGEEVVTSPKKVFLNGKQQEILFIWIRKEQLYLGVVLYPNSRECLHKNITHFSTTRNVQILVPRICLLLMHWSEARPWERGWKFHTKMDTVTSHEGVTQGVFPRVRVWPGCHEYRMKCIVWLGGVSAFW